jgi:hypothetical protein
VVAGPADLSTLEAGESIEISFYGDAVTFTRDGNRESADFGREARLIGRAFPCKWRPPGAPQGFCLGRSFGRLCVAVISGR